MIADDHRSSHDRTSRLLVVDDHPDTIEILSVLLQMLGHETRSAMRGREALRTAFEFKPDLILLDIGLPDLNGYEVVRALRADARTAGCFIVAVTAWCRPRDVTHAKEAGSTRTTSSRSTSRAFAT